MNDIGTDTRNRALTAREPEVADTLAPSDSLGMKVDRLEQAAKAALDKKRLDRENRFNEWKKALEAQYPGAVIEKLKRHDGTERQEALDSPKIGPVLITTREGKKIVAKGLEVTNQYAKASTREQEVSKRLQHQNLSGAIFWDVLGTEITVCYNYVEGRSLAECGRLPVDTVLSVAKQVLGVCSYLHNPDHHSSEGKAVVHRDLKPSNIVLDKGGKATVIDLGAVTERSVAGMHNGRATATIAIGTFDYAPPELWRGNPLPASDLYCLGLTLIELLHGSLPEVLKEESSFSMWQWQIPNDFEVIPAEGKAPEHIEPWLREVLQKMITKDLSKRYQSAEEVLKDIEDGPQRVVEDKRDELSEVQEKLLLAKKQLEEIQAQTQKARRDASNNADETSEVPEWSTGEQLVEQTVPASKPDPAAQPPAKLAHFNGAVAQFPPIISSILRASSIKEHAPDPGSSAEFPNNPADPNVSNEQIRPQRDQGEVFTQKFSCAAGTISERRGHYGPVEVKITLNNVEARDNGMLDAIGALGDELERQIIKRSKATYPKHQELVYVESMPTLQGTVEYVFTPQVQQLTDSERKSIFGNRRALDDGYIASPYHAYRIILGSKLVPAQTNFLRLWVMSKRLEQEDQRMPLFEGRAFLTVDNFSPSDLIHTYDQATEPRAVKLSWDRNGVVQSATGHPLSRAYSDGTAIDRGSLDLKYFVGYDGYFWVCDEQDYLLIAGREPGSLTGYDAGGNEVKL